MGRRWGKSVLGMVLAMACASAGGRVAWIVPTYKNGRSLWRAVEGVAGRMGKKYVRVNRTDRTIEFLESGGFIGIYSADNPDAIRGDAFNLVICDEAARIPEEVWTEVIQPTLADADGDAILISTPKGRNWFWREYQQGLMVKPDIKSWRAPSSDNPSPQIQRAAALAKTRVPDLVYRQEWEAEFVEDSATIFSMSWWGNGRNRFDARRESSDGLRIMPLRSIARWVSIDTAMKDKDSSDYSAATVAELTPDYTLRVIRVWRDKLRFPDLLEAIERLAFEANFDGKLRGVIIEDTAAGTSAYQTLTAATANPVLARLIIPFSPKGSKKMRASLAGVWCRQDCVQLPHPSEDVSDWLQPFEEELFSFTGSDLDVAHDDMVDSFSQLILYLEEQHILSTGYYARLEAQERQGDGGRDNLRAMRRR